MYAITAEYFAASARSREARSQPSSLKLLDGHDVGSSVFGLDGGRGVGPALDAARSEMASPPPADMTFPLPACRDERECFLVGTARPAPSRLGSCSVRCCAGVGRRGSAVSGSSVGVGVGVGPGSGSSCSSEDPSGPVGSGVGRSLGCSSSWRGGSSVRRCSSATSRSSVSPVSPQGPMRPSLEHCADERGTAGISEQRLSDRDSRLRMPQASSGSRSSC
mmetsp:Transcript_46752/g.123566  ORF Transcript_46752/g.123566 Transcript_46752/m.123566 type:complete len:220 (+) Transcript_46752:1332-1991(+)